MRNANAPEIGSRWRFLPAAFTVQGNNPMTLPFIPPESLYSTGTVVQIHEAHRWFRVQYECGSGTLHECFKF